MLPDFLRVVAKRVAVEKKVIRLAVFGPGKGSPFFEKRAAVVEALQREHPLVSIDFYMIDDFEDPSTGYDDYLARIRPAEIEQIRWADVILFLWTHHKLTAFVEFILVHDYQSESGEKIFDKCGMAVADYLEVSSLWFDEMKRICNGRADRMIQFSKADLLSCRVARDVAVDLFERVLLERWGRFV